jgi:hypothetical protein
VKFLAATALALLLAAPAFAGDRAEREAAARGAYDKAQQAPATAENEYQRALREHERRQEPAGLVRVLPPIEYDRAFAGVLLEIRGDKQAMERVCPKTSFGVTLGCAYVHERDCTIVVANDNILSDAGWHYEAVKRHEQGHCNGWGKDHAGARPWTPSSSFVQFPR